MNGSQTAPTGSFDTPTNGDRRDRLDSGHGLGHRRIAVGAVRLMRDPVPAEGPNLIFVGNAVFIAVPSRCRRLLPSLPLKDQAGWGLLVLTNFLPNQGNGTFKFYAYADNVDGHVTLLGTKTITVRTRRRPSRSEPSTHPARVRPFRDCSSTSGGR